MGQTAEDFYDELREQGYSHGKAKKIIMEQESFGEQMKGLVAHAFSVND